MLGRSLTRRQFLGASAVSLAGAVVGCLPAFPRQRVEESVTSRSRQATVHIGSAARPSGQTADLVGGGRDGFPLSHSSLSLYDHDGKLIPMLAERLPSFDDGTWVANPDGTMRLTWHLRRNVKWHDGHPFTARDVRFSWELQNDTSLAWNLQGPTVRSVSSIDAPDDYTLVMHWRDSNAFANAATLGDLPIYPEHLIRPLWEAGDGERLFSDDFFREGFVGLGPYRMERWNPDGTIVYTAFDDFFLGRPNIGTFVKHTYDTFQGVLTALLAGTVQMTGEFSLRFEEAVAAQEQWEARGQGKVYFTPTGFMRVFLPPQNPLFADVRVRKALLLAIDRAEIVHTMFRDTTLLAHTLLHPSEVGFQAADQVVAKYGFAPRLTVSLMEQAGWRRGTDGILTNGAGDRFEVPYRVLPTETEQLRIQGAIADYWKDIGVHVIIDNVAANVQNDRTERATFRGATMSNPAVTLASLHRRWHSSQIPRPETRFVGDNSAAWNNPAADQLLDRIATTIDLPQAVPDLVALAKLFADELPCLPLHFITEPVAIHRSLKGARPRANSSAQNSITWSAYQWEWE